MSRILFLAFFLHVFAIYSQPFILAQDAKNPAPQDTAADAADAADAEQATNEASTDEGSEAAADDEQTLTAAAISKLINDKEIEAAAKALEKAIAADPKNERLQTLREPIATRFLSARKYGESLKQMKALFEYRIKNVAKPSSQVRLPTTVSLLRMAALRTGNRDLGDEALDRAIEAISENDLGVVSIQTIANLLPQKAMQLAAKRDLEGANELLFKRIDQIDSLDASGSMKEALVSAKAKLLYAAVTLPESSPETKAKLEAFIDAAAIDSPKSNLILLEYGRVQSMLIGRLYRDDPQAAKDKLDTALAVLEPASVDDRNLGMYVSRLKSYESRIELALQVIEMIGKPAPEMQIAAWVNQGDITQESLQGKVVLLDFWSVWCGPCIATFPHLREWHDEFHDQGFEVVGVTRYYNYTWDDEAKRAKRSTDPVEADDEHEMLTQFMNHHDLRHPTIVTPKDSTMQKEFGVTGIPHAVLIDRKGNVQMIKVGSGPANAKALHEKIDELIAQ